MRLNFIATSLLLALFFCASPSPLEAHQSRAPRRERIVRECVPLNGFYGYYGNPWCDTGSYRLEDIWYRERHKTEARAGARQ